jgi:hypothetical protein
MIGLSNIETADVYLGTAASPALYLKNVAVTPGSTRS